MPDVTFINLQYVDFAEDLNQIKNDLGVTVHNFDDLDHFNNIDDVAALCTALDMVVSTKTTVPLISSAVGTSTKLANWKQSPWNNVLLNPHGPSIDVFERNTWEPWEDVFKLITKDILKKTTVNKPENNNPIEHPPQELIDQLINQYNQGQLEAMAEQAKALTKQYPHAFVIWNCLGVANLDLGRIEEASEAFEKVTELNPNYVDGYNNLGVALQEQGKLDQAIEIYEKLLLIKPNYVDAYYKNDNVLNEQGKLVDAIEAYKKAIYLKPDYTDTYINMGVALKDLGKLDEAI